MRRNLITWCLRAIEWLRPKPDLRPVVQELTKAAVELSRRNDAQEAEAMERISELIDARQMAGGGPWRVSPQVLEQTDELIGRAISCMRRGVPLREAGVPISAGALGDIELALQNVDWRREVNISWLEFSRWGIQQIILISRLYYIKNPIIRRLINVCASYVFARGVEVSSPDKALNDIIDAFLHANRKVLGQRALVRAEKKRDYDGNLFWVFFDDEKDTGETALRMIDATEIQEIETDPEDTDTPWFYHRVCSQRVFDPKTGSASVKTLKVWYPALGYDPPAKSPTIGGDQVMWGQPIYHSKSGEVGKWNFGCPRAYPALDWAKEARKYLEACASVKQSNAQIAREITTKGGQQAIQGIKGQLQTTVGPAAAIWDQNPTAVAGSTMVTGPGTTTKLVGMRNMSDSPEEVRRYLLMCCMVWDVPETFLGDVSTGNLATATSLDRPTETSMLDRQEAWREDLMVIVMHHLEVSKGAPNGKLREALSKRGLDPGKVTIREAARVPSRDGSRMVYAQLEEKAPTPGEPLVLHEAGKPVPKNTLLVRVNFPAIREGDVKLLVDAQVQSMTLGNRAGQIIGIDEKAGVRRLYQLLDYEDGDELTEEQYPEKEYERDRTKEILPPPIARPPVGLPGGSPIASAEQPEQAPDRQTNLKAPVKEALARFNRAVRAWESNGHKPVAAGPAQ